MRHSSKDNDTSSSHGCSHCSRSSSRRRGGRGRLGGHAPTAPLKSRCQALSTSGFRRHLRTCEKSLKSETRTGVDLEIAEVNALVRRRARTALPPPAVQGAKLSTSLCEKRVDWRVI